MEEKWFIRGKKGADIQMLSKGHNISEFQARLISNREIKGDKLIDSYLNPDYDKLHNPKIMKDIEKAAEILKEKIEQKKKIRIVGDYDVDGVTSTYILKSALTKCGADADYRIPDRIKDGYGINEDIIRKAAEDGIDTILTCDNGIAALEASQKAKEAGITMIITDHHEVPFEETENGKKYIIPEADAIVNPKQPECPYEFKMLCGAGIAYKLIKVLYEKMNINECAEDYMDALAIATVCDVVDLLDENRVFVRKGLEVIKNTKNTGLKSLIKECGLEDKEITIYHFGFVIGPCINATGRLESAEEAVELLLSEDENEAAKSAKRLRELNADRKELTAKGVEECISMIEHSEIINDKVLVVFDKTLHESLAGIVSGKIREKYNKPVMVITGTDKPGIVKGSGRSIDEYNMFEEISKCRNILLKFGGHPMAAGFSLAEDKVEEFRALLNANTKLTEEDLARKIMIDLPVSLDNINYNFLDELKTLEPFGKGNSRPVFAQKNVNVIKAYRLGKEENMLKLTIKTAHGKFVDGIKFNGVEQFENCIKDNYGLEELEKIYHNKSSGIKLDIIFCPEINEYNGKKYIQLKIETFRAS